MGKIKAVLGFDMETDIGSWTSFYDGFKIGAPRILKVLDKHGISATFFFTGDSARKNPEIVKMARDAAPFQSFIDPDDESFANPPSMIKAIKEFCQKTGQKVPRNHMELIRCIFESLALKYKNVLDKFRSLAPFPIERLHIIGGGAKNRLLNQFTANSTGVTVVAGPSEGTAIGNIMLQARAAGCVNSLQEMRDMISDAIEIETFTPEDTDAWNAAYDRIKSLIK